MTDIVPVLGEYYWIEYYNEIVVGYYSAPFNFERWEVCGSDELILLNEVSRIISHIERPVK